MSRTFQGNKTSCQGQHYALLENMSRKTATARTLLTYVRTQDQQQQQEHTEKNNKSTYQLSSEHQSLQPRN